MLNLKLTAETEGSLFTQGKNSGMNLTFSSADETLHSIAKAEFKDAKQAALFEIFNYGNGQFAIGFRNGKSILSG